MLHQVKAKTPTYGAELGLVHAVQVGRGLKTRDCKFPLERGPRELFFTAAFLGSGYLGEDVYRRRINVEKEGNVFG